MCDDCLFKLPDGVCAKEHSRTDRERYGHVIRCPSFEPLVPQDVEELAREVDAVVTAKVAEAFRKIRLAEKN